MITVIDYGVGNIGSILNMLRKIEVPCQATSDPAVIRNAQKLILPGVGHFNAGALALKETGIGETIIDATSRGVPLLGVCLGMQLLTNGSAEGGLDGLGLVSGKCFKLDLKNQGLRVPHMGWNRVTPVENAKLFGQGVDELRYYFVHSYHVVCDDPSDVAATCFYGIQFTCAFQRDHIFGVQFHPEKSHRFGMEVLRQFSKV